MKATVATGVEQLPFMYDFPEVIRISYDLAKLSIQVSFYKFNDEIVDLEFSKVIGFRVLDEGNL